MLGATPARAGPVQGATGLIVGLVNAWVIALLSLNLGAASVADAILLGALVWLGFGATFKAAQVAFERRPWAVWVMQAIHDLTAEVVVADEPRAAGQGVVRVVQRDRDRGTRRLLQRLYFARPDRRRRREGHREPTTPGNARH